jgi:hypothetical protein
MDQTQKLESLQKRADELTRKKIQAETELTYLEKQHAEVIKELKELGIDNLEDIPSLIAEYSDKIEKQITNIEQSLTQIEKEVS